MSPQEFQLEKRKKMITEEIDKIIESAQDFCFTHYEEEMEEEAVQGLKDASFKLAYTRKYYDVHKDEVVYFPSVARLIMTNRLQDEAEKSYFEEDDEWPVEYTKALKSAIANKNLEEEAENEEYMEKLATDVEGV